MTIVERRNRSPIPNIEPDLLDQGISQLNAEIQRLHIWIDKLDPSETELTRSYKDMLHSRHEMLQSLTQQRSRLQAAKANGEPSSD